MWRILRDWKKLVDIVYEDTCALPHGVKYGCYMYFSNKIVLNQLSVSKDFSILVLCHELGHFCDHRIESYEGLRYNNDLEYRALNETRANMYGLQIAAHYGFETEFIKMSKEFFEGDQLNDFEAIVDLFQAEDALQEAA